MKTLSGKWIYAFLILLGVFTTGAFLLNAHFGVGVGADSLFYLTSAQNFAQGRGLSWTGSGGQIIPLTHYPPAYPLLIAALLKAGMEVVRAATWVSGVLMGVNAALAGFLLYRVTGNALFGGVTSIVLVVSPFFLDLHTMAMSEPLFIFFVLASLGMLSEYLLSPSWGWLVGSALAATLAFMTRYVGISLVTTGILVLWVYRDAPLRRRAGEIVAFGAIILGPILIWLARNRLATGHATNRILFYHPVGIESRSLAFKTLLGWLYPGLPRLPYPELKTYALIFCAVIAAWAIFVAWKTITPAQRSSLSTASFCSFRFSMIWLAFAALYACGIAFSLYFFDASTRLDNRILSPVYIALLLAFFSSVSGARLPTRAAGLVLAGVLLFLYIPFFAAQLSVFRQEGLAYTSRPWRESQVVDYLRGVSSAAVIYSNQALPLQFLSGRNVLSIPYAFDPVKGQTRPNYPGEVSKFHLQLQKPHSALVLFDADKEMTQEEIANLLRDLKSVLVFPNATVYVSPANIANDTLP